MRNHWIFPTTGISHPSIWSRDLCILTFHNYCLALIAFLKVTLSSLFFFLDTDKIIFWNSLHLKKIFHEYTHLLKLRFLLLFKPTICSYLVLHNIAPEKKRRFANTKLEVPALDSYLRSLYLVYRYWNVKDTIESYGFLNSIFFFLYVILFYEKRSGKCIHPSIIYAKGKPITVCAFVGTSASLCSIQVSINNYVISELYRSTYTVWVYVKMHYEIGWSSIWRTFLESPPKDENLRVRSYDGRRMAPIFQNHAPGYV